MRLITARCLLSGGRRDILNPRKFRREDRQHGVSNAAEMKAALATRHGRRPYRRTSGAPSDAGGQPIGAAAELVAEAGAAYVVTIADNAVLSICTPAAYRGDLPERFAESGSSCSRSCTGRVTKGDWRADPSPAAPPNTFNGGTGNGKALLRSARRLRAKEVRSSPLS
jgi:hypothetical protein